MSGQRQSATGQKQLDAASYDDAAAEFDRLSERFNQPLAMRMLELARLQSSDHVLDVGTGTGLVALRAARLVQNGRVVGIDHSPGMLDQALAKARGSGLNQTVMFQRMDAEQLGFPDHTFDVVLSLYALFHFPDPRAAIREMHRVLRPGGRVVIGVGTSPELLSWGGIVHGLRAASRRIAAARGRMLTAPKFLLSLMREHGMAPDEEHQPAGTTVAPKLQQAGFRQVRRCWQGHCEALDPEEFWRLQVTYASAARIRLQRASAAELTALKDSFFERCRTVQAKGGKLTYPHAAMYYTAHRV